MRARRREHDDTPSRPRLPRPPAHRSRRFGTVFTAYQEHFDRTVALKILEIEMVDEQSQRRYARECAAAGRLTGHPNIVTVFESGFTTDGKPYIAMEHFALGSLAVRLRNEGSLPLADVLRIGVRISGASGHLDPASSTATSNRPTSRVGLRRTGLADFGIAAVALRDQSVHRHHDAVVLAAPGGRPRRRWPPTSTRSARHAVLPARRAAAVRRRGQPASSPCCCRCCRQVPDIERPTTHRVVDVLRRGWPKRASPALRLGGRLRRRTAGAPETARPAGHRHGHRSVAGTAGHGARR